MSRRSVSVAVTGLIILCLVVLISLPTLRHQHRRWSEHGHFDWEEEPGEDPIGVNLWYKYVKVLVKSYNMSNCYVCSVMPHSAKQNTLYGKPMNKTQAKCYASFAGCGYQNRYIQINDSDIYRTGLKDGTCDSMFWVKFNHTSQGKPIGHKVFFNHTLKHPMCYNQTIGTIYMGSTLNCEQIWCGGEGAPVDVSVASNGTYVVQGGWWLCGRTAYMSLPANWIGQCAPIHITDHTFIMSAVPGAVARRRRSVPTFVPHDPIWGEDVPDEFKLWSTSNKVTLSLFPQIGVGKVMLRLETLDYRLGLFINASQVIDTAQNKEISNIRTMVMQNRMTLDLLTASGGGVCVLLNTTCCTYVSDDVNSDAVRDALGTLTKLKDAMTADYRPDHNGGWNIFHNLFGWMTPFISMMIPIIVVVLLICCCGPYIVQCVMNRVYATIESMTGRGYERMPMR